MGRELLIIGAGGHGKVAADIAKKMEIYDRIAFLDDDVSKRVDGYAILGTVKEYGRWKETYEFFIAVGNNTVRRDIQKRLERQAQVATLVHPSAVIGDGVELGDGTIVMANAVINSGTVTGAGVIVNTGSTIDHDCRIGSYVHVAPGCHISGNVAVGDGSWIGVGSCIANNVRLCSECLIGAGAAVIRDIEKRGTYVGVPAKMIKYGGRDAQTGDL